MAKFHFTLAPLLKLRSHERDMKREALARTLGELQRLQTKVTDNEQTQNSALQQLQSLSAAGKVDINGCAQLRYYLSFLKREAVQLADAVRKYQPDVEQAREELVLADQAVKALEKLQTKQQTAHQFETQKREQLQLEDLWQAGQQVLGKNSSS